MKTIRPLMLVLLQCLLGAGTIHASTIGDAVIPRGAFDGGTGQLIVYGGHFPINGETVTTWSFYSDAAASNDCSTGHASYVCYPGATITPVILSISSAGVFEVTGIGTTRTNTLGGAQTYDFDLVSGTDVVGPDSTAGFRSGGPLDTGDFDFGVVDYNDTPSVGWYGFGERDQVTVGETVVGQLVARGYSASFSTSAPEPATTITFGMGVALLAIWRLRHKKRLPA